MKVTSQGNIYSIHSDLLQTHDNLPPDVYYVRFSMEKGFYLLKRPQLEIKENKIYGILQQKCDKILAAFELFERNLGVIFSGDKGTGKTLSVKQLSLKAIEKGYPVLIVDHCSGGLSDFLVSIEQQCVVLFDEFDKTFNSESQNELLSLLDGITVGKKMFVVTCNSLSKLSEFMINRPGRFHYHLRFEYPNATEVREYLEDKLPKQFHNEIKEVVVFSRKVKLNFDCLRAIAFELSMGLSFQEAIKDLNILNVDTKSYDAALMYDDGAFLTANDLQVDLFDKNNQVTVRLSDENDDYIVSVSFSVGDLVWNESVQALGVPMNKVKIAYVTPDSIQPRFSLFEDVDEEKEKEELVQRINEYAKRNPAIFTIEHVRASNPHY